MADFRKQAKENPLKPARVNIPQLDPLAEISHPLVAEPELKASVPITATVVPPEPPTSPELQPEISDIDSYKSKHLHKDEDKVTKTFRMYRRRSDQLDEEVRTTTLDHWQIIDIGLEMYFRDKHRKQEAEASASQQ